jgi:type IV pilus assembly protein PilX
MTTTMMMMINTRPASDPAAERQRGVVLIVGLIMLLVLTLLGLAASSGTTLEEKMVRNDQRHQIAFQAAEAALKDAQTRLLLGDICTTFDNNHGCYQPPTSNQPPTAKRQPLWQSIKWNDADSIAYSGTLAGTSNKPRYFVEQLPPEPAPGNNIGACYYGCAAPTQVFQITSEATSTDTPKEVVLQSVYRP